MAEPKIPPFMPRGVAVWLIDNTGLTFDQIASFCDLHRVEVQGMADGEVAVGVAPCNPVSIGQITQEEIEACEKDGNRVPRLATQIYDEYNLKKSSRKRRDVRYVPIAVRRDKPDAVFWILKHCPEMGDDQIKKLIGTTKSTIEAIRNRKHWNSNNIKPRHPVLLNLCSQEDLDEEMMKAQIAAEKARRLKKIEE